jgi:hypothetical protein
MTNVNVAHFSNHEMAQFSTGADTKQRFPQFMLR